MYTVTLEDAGKESNRKVGSKALHLGELMNQNIRIPDGFVITSDALDYFMEANRLNGSDEEVESGEKLLNSPIPAALEQDIAARFKQLRKDACDSGLSVAVRSSSSAEDMQQASFAGQYETILHVENLPNLLESVKACWASMFSARVRQYAQQKNVAAGMSFFVPMGILVQRMVFADVSGVVFSMNPVNQNGNEIVINASYGLGEAIVSGVVTPDAYYIDKNTGKIRKELGLKEVKIECAGRGTRETATTEQEQNSYCLSDAEIDTLARETQKIEAFYRHPVDIEFAVKDQELYILQARPITT